MQLNYYRSQDKKLSLECHCCISGCMFNSSNKLCSHTPDIKNNSCSKALPIRINNNMCSSYLLILGKNCNCCNKCLCYSNHLLTLQLMYCKLTTLNLRQPVQYCKLWTRHLRLRVLFDKLTMLSLKVLDLFDRVSLQYLKLQELHYMQW